MCKLFQVTRALLILAIVLMAGMGLVGQKITRIKR